MGDLRSMASSMIFQQLFEHESSTYTYILADSKTREAVIIDPVLETSARDIQLIEELNLKLLYILETHVHADHITGADLLKTKFGAKTCVSASAEIQCADIRLTDGQIVEFGKHRINVLETRGHTNSCLSYHIEDRVFTGDALLIRGCGRTDFQQGSSETLYESVTKKLFVLAPETLVYPAHDYQGRTSSSIEMEMKFNPRLGMNKSKEEFKAIMANLKLAQPKKIEQAVPANLVCGRMP